MKELTINEVDQVNGGITENQCIGIMSMVGGVTGGIAGFMAAGPAGGFAGSGFGFAFGGAYGMIVCAPLISGSWSMSSMELEHPYFGRFVGVDPFLS